jgi:DNA-directed RNA polymerase specialized sigma54-like protein
MAKIAGWSVCDRCVDENGYLAQYLKELAELLPAELDISLDDLETALVQLQHMDQPGLGAQSGRMSIATQALRKIHAARSGDPSGEQSSEALQR